MGEAGALMQYLLALWNEWEIQAVVVLSFSLQLTLFFFAGIRRYTVSSVLRSLLWLVYLFADVVATYALGHMASSLSKKSSGENQLVAFWAPFLLLHLGGQDTITAYALEDNALWRRHLLNMFVQVAGTAYVLYKYITAGGATYVHAAVLVLAAGVVKYGERIWALKLASKGGSPRPPRIPFLLMIQYFFRSSCGRWSGQLRREMPYKHRQRRQQMHEDIQEWLRQKGGDRFTKNKQFRAYAFIVMIAHVLRHLLVKPVIIDRNKASIRWNDQETIGLVKGLVQGFPWQDDESEDASAKEKRTIGQLYKGIEVQLGLMYDMLYTKAEVIHKGRGHCIRAISLVCCFTALVVFTKSKRDGYSTPNIIITFALLGGACALEVTSVFKAIGSTWAYDVLRRYRCKWLANAVLFARYHLVVVKDGRWSNSVGQFDFISFCVHSRKRDLKGRIARLIGVKDFWDKARCTKHAKLSPTLKEFVWALLRGDKTHMVEIEEVDMGSGNWARRFIGIDDRIKQLDWSLSFEFQKSVLIWHIATSIFLNHSAIKLKLADKDMAEEVNTLSDYMMYLLVRHPDILPMKPAAEDMLEDTCHHYDSHVIGSNISNVVVDPHKIILDYKEQPGSYQRTVQLYCDLMQDGWDAYVGKVVLAKAGSVARTMLDMELGLPDKMAIIGTVWTEMLCYAATNATGGFHARQLSNGGEFLTHILLLAEYSSLIDKKPTPPIEADETVDASAVAHVHVNVDDDSNNEITEIRPT